MFVNGTDGTEITAAYPYWYNDHSHKMNVEIVDDQSPPNGGRVLKTSALTSAASLYVPANNGVSAFLPEHRIPIPRGKKWIHY